MSFFSDVKAVLNAFVDGCKDGAQEEKIDKVEKFDEVKVPDWVKKSNESVVVPEWIKKSN
jgi:hypothetical protein